MSRYQIESGESKQHVSCTRFTNHGATPNHCYICGVPKEQHEETFETVKDMLLGSVEAYEIERLMLTEAQFDKSERGGV